MILELIAGALAILAAFALLMRWHQKRQDVMRYVQRKTED